MPRPFDLQSEPYQPTGSISADGIKNQLGRPKFDRLTLLAREAVQNSWDARDGDTPVIFGVAGWDLTDQQRGWLLNSLFKRVPPAGLDIRQQLQAGDPAAVLAIYDRGTRGLAGPTRADSVRAKDHANFVNFLRNVGQPPTAFRGGGTYGFGKTALFLASCARTIIVHTQVAAGRSFEQRFMASSLGAQYTHGRVRGTAKRYTGRHWWGRKGKGGVVDPVIGRDANNAALALGLPLFHTRETGTTILVLLPDFDGRSPEDAIRYIGGSILRSFWPKMLDGPREAGTVKFELSWNHSKIALPRPQNVPPLDGYAKAFANLQAHLKGKTIPHQPSAFYTIRSQRPIKKLGVLSLVRFPPSPRLTTPHFGEEAHEESSPFLGPSRHTALMRGPRFVVNYLEGPPIPYEHAEYAGVFIVSEEAEEAFAKAEPPTHDDWSPEMLDNRNDKVFVRVAMRRIKEAMLEFTGASSIPRDGITTVALGAFSDLLGGLIPAEHGTGARPDGSAGGRAEDGSGDGGGATRGGRRTRIRILETTQPDLVSGVPVFTIKFDLDSATRAAPVTISALPMVVLEEGVFESEPPVGSQRPRVLFWSNKEGGIAGREEQLEIPPTEDGPWSVAVAMPPDAAVAVDIVAQDAK